jgi:hypothetical protein
MCLGKMEHSHSSGYRISCFYRGKRISLFTRAYHWILCWTALIHSIPLHLVSLRSNMLLSSRLHVGLPSSLFPWCFWSILHLFLISSHAISFTHPFFLYSITLTFSSVISLNESVKLFLTL